MLEDIKLSDSPPPKKNEAVYSAAPLYYQNFCLPVSEYLQYYRIDMYEENLKKETNNVINWT